MEPTLPAAHALHLARVLERWRVAADDLLGPLGLAADALADPGARLPLATVIALVERARRLSGEPGLGILLGARMRVSSHGYLGFAVMTAATVRDALEIAIRYLPTRTTALGLSLHVEREAAAIIVDERADLGAARDVVLLALLLGIGQVGRELTGRPLAGDVDLALAEPPYFARLRGLAPGRVRWGQPASQLLFDPAILDLPHVAADPAAARLAREGCERELASLGQTDAIAARSRRLLARPGGGFRSLDELAAELHLSPRTLKRRLAAEGTTFSRLLEDERRARALLLLRSSTLPLAQVAARLGYSDLSNFTRAFRSWTGLPPGAVRRGRGR